MSAAHGPATGRSKRLGRWCAVLGLVSLAALVWLWVLSATPLDPPNWVRILGLVWLPVGVVGALFTGIPALRGEGRPGALVGLIAAAVTVIAFVVLINVLG